MVAGELIPIIVVPVVFGAIVLIMKYIMDYRTAAKRLEAEGGATYRKLAEEAVSSQRQLLDEVQRMNRTLQEIERILREV